MVLSFSCSDIDGYMLYIFGEFIIEYISVSHQFKVEAYYIPRVRVRQIGAHYTFCT